MTRALLAGAMCTALAVPAFADVERYFVALDTTIKQCRVMSTEPDGTVMKMIGDSAYSTLDEAEQALTTLPECRS